MMFSHGAAASQSTKNSVSSFVDDEFGVVTCRRSPRSRYIRLKVDEKGNVYASLPPRTPLYLVKKFLDDSRIAIREMVAQQHSKRVVYEDGMLIGHSHRLSIRYAQSGLPKSRLHGQLLDVVLPLSLRGSAAEQQYLADQIKKALRREATAYLPRRLRHLATQFGFEYKKVRFGNQRGRWGSCSSSGTISLNVALMSLSNDLIDYVLIHELSHTKQMNHSRDFWELVEACMPAYKEKRKTLKTMSPIC